MRGGGVRSGILEDGFEVVGLGDFGKVGCCGKGGGGCE